MDSDGEVRTTLKLEPRYESAGEVMTKLVELDAEPQTVRAGIQSAGITSFGSVTIPRQSRGHSGCEPLKAAVRGR